MCNGSERFNSCSICEGIYCREDLERWVSQKKAIGFITAVTLGHLIGLEINNNIGWQQVICIASFMLRDMHTCYQVQKAEKDGIPIHIFRDQLMTSSRGQDATIMKLIVWDFAGDSVYQAMQHFFLPERAIYMLVFSLEAAWENPMQQIEKLKQWLYTIKAHAEIHDALVFIVGTHLDSVRNHVGFLTDMAEEIRKSLYNDFCGVLAINAKHESPLFVVENSRPIDEDGLLLRETIKRKAKERPFLKQEQPVWYLRLLDMIRQWKSGIENPWFMKRDFLVEEANRNGFGEEEVERFLRFCHTSGEFIYRNDDDVMKNYVILDPQHLLDIMKDLLKFPSLSDRLLENAENWQALQTNGVASVDLITEIVGDDRELVNTVTRFLEAYNMLLPIQPGNGNSFTHCIVPSHLPEEPVPYRDWDSADDDEEYFFDFGYVPSEVIFHRLIARCWYHNLEEARTNGRLYHQRGIFCFKEDSIFSCYSYSRIPSSNNSLE
ncbi:probable serine/threonine-protein kinase roco6 [Amphiura filiformis]|uniref:probable serine/threonine-protein kinase roco6 n=1 Tax=Amphiura filiformis TaxID=82378 RepID=UPI003B21C797